MFCIAEKHNSLVTLLESGRGLPVVVGREGVEYWSVQLRNLNNIARLPPSPCYVEAKLVYNRGQPVSVGKQHEVGILLQD